MHTRDTVDWYGPVYHSTQKAEEGDIGEVTPMAQRSAEMALARPCFASQAELQLVPPPDQKSKGLEMRRAILIHRFMEAYKQTVTIKDNKPVGHARKGEPAVTGTAALTAFAASYMGAVSYTHLTLPTICSV